MKNPLKAIFPSAMLGIACLAHAQSRSVDFIFIVDESGSMAGEQSFLQVQIPSLNAGLQERNITDNRFGLVGFGASNPSPRSVSVNGGLFGTAEQFAAAADTLIVNGATEDGYAGLIFALDNYEFRPGVLPVLVLVTDEDRDIISPYRDSDLAARDASFTNATAFVQSLLSANDAIWVSILDQNILSSAGVGGNLAINSINQVYQATVNADGTAGISVEDGGSLGSAFGTTTADYSEPTLANGGLVADLNQLRQGGLTADSFTLAFLDSLVEVVQVGVGTNLVIGTGNAAFETAIETLLGRNTTVPPGETETEAQRRREIARDLREIAKTFSGFVETDVDRARGLLQGRPLLNTLNRSIGGSYTYTNVLTHRFDALHHRAVTTGQRNADSRFGTFLQGMYANTEIDATGASFSSESSNWGALAGIDYTVSDRLILGLGFGYKRTGIDSSDGSEIEGDTFAGMLYGSWIATDHIFFDAFGSYGQAKLDSTRDLGIFGLPGAATGEIEQDLVSLGLRAKGQWQSGGFVFGPTAQLQWVYASSEAFRETGPAAVTLDVEDSDQHSFRSFLGGFLAYPLDDLGIRFTPRISIEWVHEFADTSTDTTVRFTSAPAAPFAVSSDEVAKDVLRGTIGGTFYLSDGASLYAYYTRTLVQDDQTDNVVQFGLNFDF